jgi:hypothetical protein
MNTTGAQTQHDRDEFGGGEDGVVLSAAEEAELEQVIAETDEDERMGRVFTLAEVLADLRRA